MINMQRVKRIRVILYAFIIFVVLFPVIVTLVLYMKMLQLEDTVHAYMSAQQAMMQTSQPAQSGEEGQYVLPQSQSSALGAQVPSLSPGQAVGQSDAQSSLSGISSAPAPPPAASQAEAFSGQQNGTAQPAVQPPAGGEAPVPVDLPGNPRTGT